jgi:NADPH2:quinone reductase
MHAIQAVRRGGPEVLQLQELDRPEPGPGELLVELAATGVNFVDVYRRNGTYLVDYPNVPGTEGAGRIVAVGAGVSGFVEGDRVATAEGRRTYAEFAIVPASAAAKVPDGVPDDVAGALPLQGITAHYLVTSVFPVDAGTTLLVHAGAGGVGLLLIQLAKARGATVYTTVGSPRKRPLAEGAGADAVLEYDGFDERVRELTGGRGVDVVMDPVGGDRFTDSLRSLAPEGRLLVVGFTGGDIPTVKVNRLLLNNVGVLGVGWGAFLAVEPAYLQEQWAELCDLLSLGTVVPLPVQTRDFADAPAVLADMDARTLTGKVVLTL